MFEREEALILELRRHRNLGARRIQNELRRQHDLSLSLETIHKVLSRAEVRPLVRPPRRKGAKRYARPTPGERVQMDTCKIASGCYQYTAVGDCTRDRVLAVFPRRTATNALTFLDQVIEEMPFPMQRVQTDRGREFFAVRVQRYLMEHCIKFRPIKPRSPHLNGKVERSQRTDLEEFWATADPKDPEIESRLAEWQHDYNWERPHGSLQGKTPMECFFEKIDGTPLLEQIEALYEPGKERLQEADYRQDQLLHRLHLQAIKPPEHEEPEVTVAD